MKRNHPGIPDGADLIIPRPVLSSSISACNRGGIVRSPTKLIADIALAALCLGLTPLAKKAALVAGVSALPLALATTGVAAALAITPFAFRGVSRRLARHGSRTYLHVFLVGAMGSGAVVLLSVLAMTETTATNRSLFQSMYPVATAICARLLLGERLAVSAYTIIAAMSFGLFLMNTGPEGLVIGRSFWMLAATLPLIGLADVYARRTLFDADPRFVAAGRLFFGALFLLVLLPWIPGDDWYGLAAEWPWILAAGVTMAGGVLGLYRAMDTAGASRAAAFIGLAPVVTSAAEWAVLGASFSLLQMTGIALVVAGAAALAYRV